MKVEIEIHSAVASLVLDVKNSEARQILALVARGMLKRDYVYGMVNGLQAGLRALGGVTVVGDAAFDRLNEFENAARMPNAKLIKFLSEGN